MAKNTISNLKITKSPKKNHGHFKKKKKLEMSQTFIANAAKANRIKYKKNLTRI